MSIFEQLQRYAEWKRDHIITDELGKHYLMRMANKTFDEVFIFSEEETNKHKMTIPPGIPPIEDAMGYRFFKKSSDYYLFKIGCMSPTGGVFGNGMYDSIGPCNKFLLLVKDNGEYFYVNKFGDRQVMPPVPYCQRMELHPETGVSSFMINDKWGLCDNDSKVIFDAILDSKIFDIEHDSYGEGYIVVKFVTDYLEHKAGKCAFLKVDDAKEGRIVLSTDWSKLYPFKNGEAHAVNFIYTPDGEVGGTSQHFMIDMEFKIKYEWDEDTHGNVIPDEPIWGYSEGRDDSPLDAFEGEVDLYNDWLMN